MEIHYDHNILIENQSYLSNEPETDINKMDEEPFHDVEPSFREGK
jgi:hypothetical protein